MRQGAGPVKRAYFAATDVEVWTILVDNTTYESYISVDQVPLSEETEWRQVALDSEDLVPFPEDLGRRPVHLE